MLFSDVQLGWKLEEQRWFCLCTSVSQQDSSFSGSTQQGPFNIHFSCTSPVGDMIIHISLSGFPLGDISSYLVTLSRLSCCLLGS